MSAAFLLFFLFRDELWFLLKGLLLSSLLLLLLMELLLFSRSLSISRVKQLVNSRLLGRLGEGQYWDSTWTEEEGMVQGDVLQSSAGHRLADFTSQTPIFILTLIYIAQTTSEQTISPGISMC